MKRWLDPDEFEQEFNMSKSTQSKKRSSGKLPYSKFGGFVRYDRLKIDRLFEEHDIEKVS